MINKSGNLKKYYIIIIIVIWLFYALIWIDKYPLLFMDENWDLVTPYSVITKGKFATPFLSEIFSEHFRRVEPRLFHLVLFIPFGYIFGVSHITARILTVLLGLGSIVFLFYLMKKYLNDNVAFAGSLLLITETLFWTISRSYRPEIGLTFITIASFYFLDKVINKSNLSSWFMLGLFTGIGGWTHLNFVFIAIGIFVFLLYHYKTRLLKDRGFYYYLIGGIIGFLPFALWILYSGINLFHEQTIALRSDRTGPFSSLLTLLNTIYLEGRRYSNVILFPKRILVFIIEIGSLIYIFKKRKKNPTFLGILFVSVFYMICIAAFITHKTPRYIACLIPVFVFSLMILLKDLYETGYKRIAYTIFTIFLLNNLAGNAFVLYRDRNESYSIVREKIRNVIPMNTRIFGSTNLWLALKENEYLITDYFRIDGFLKFDPDYIVLINPDSRYVRTSQIIEAPYNESIDNYKYFYDWMKDYVFYSGGKLIGTYEVGRYGPIDVFKVRK